MVSRTFRIKPHSSGFAQLVTIDGIDEMIDEVIDRAQDKIGAALVNNTQAVLAAEASFARPDGDDRELRKLVVDMCLHHQMPVAEDNFAFPRQLIAFIKGDEGKAEPAAQDEKKVEGRGVLEHQASIILDDAYPVGTEIDAWRFREIIEQCMAFGALPKSEWRVMTGEKFWRRVS